MRRVSGACLVQKRPFIRLLENKAEAKKKHVDYEPPSQGLISTRGEDRDSEQHPQVRTDKKLPRVICPEIELEWAWSGDQPKMGPVAYSGIVERLLLHPRHRTTVYYCVCPCVRCILSRFYDMYGDGYSNAQGTQMGRTRGSKYPQYDGGWSTAGKLPTLSFPNNLTPRPFLLRDEKICR